MKFSLPPERRAELEQNVAELERWVRELEELDLEDFDPILDPSPRNEPDHA